MITRRLLIVVGLPLVLVSLVGTEAGRAEALLVGAIRGEVRARSTGDPVVGALIELPELGLRARSNEGGEFAWPAIPLAEPVQPATITVSASGFGGWRIDGVRLIADDTLLLTVDLQAAPVQLTVPEVPLERPARPVGQPEPEPPISAASITSIPASVRVRVTGNAYCDTSAPYTVETVDFIDYVANVLPNEWPGGWPGESYRAGAMAVKMYAWYWIAQGGKWSDADVYDSTCDQVYISGVAYGSTNRAIAFTWNWLLTRNDNLISLHYLDTSARCNDYGWDDCIGQWDTYWHALGNNGYDKLTWDEMLFRYFEGTQLDPVNLPPPAGLALRFFGNGFGDIDRVKIPLDPPLPVDVGADFTLEWWMKANAAENGSSACSSGAHEAWINGNIIFDRDVYGSGDYGDYGVSLAGGRIAFGVNNGSESYTLCSPTGVADGAWHHIAVTRSSAGEMRVFVDGQLDAQASGPAGDISYRDGRPSSYPNSDPYLVIGAEKHDAGPAYPSYSGWLDEIRLSNSVRYSASFAPPQAPFAPDAQTVALYHLDEGFGDLIGDSSGVGPSDGQRNYGGVINGPEWMISDLFLPYKLYLPLVTD